MREEIRCVALLRGINVGSRKKRENGRYKKGVRITGFQTRAEVSSKRQRHF
jgi:hypothetical protein